MPRFLASLISVLAVVAVIVGIAVLILPPLANVFVRFATDIPTAAEVDKAVADLQGRLGNLPEGSAAVIIPVLTALAAAFRDTVSGAAGGLDDVVRTAVAALLNTIGALLGLIVLPTWMLVVMSDKERARAGHRPADHIDLPHATLGHRGDRRPRRRGLLRGYVVTAGSSPCWPGSG